jgi:hypothetical protein
MHLNSSILSPSPNHFFFAKSIASRQRNKLIPSCLVLHLRLKELASTIYRIFILSTILARLLASEDLWVWIRTSPKNQEMCDFAKGVATHSLAAKTIQKQ